VTAAADSSPLILFSRAGRLSLLRDLFDEIWIPPAVSREAFLDDPTRPGAAEIAEAMGNWLRERAPTDAQEVAALVAAVDLGEAEAIALAREHGLTLIIDDLAGRRAAEANGVPIIGSAGVLGLAKHAGLLPLMQPALDELIRVGLRLSAPLYRQILADAGES
jgi:predicted nucleic acid-binding protein